MNYHEQRGHRVVFGIIKDQKSSELATKTLKSQGFRDSDVYVFKFDPKNIQYGVLGWMASVGIPEYEALRYEAMVNNGGILISAYVDDALWGAEARAILEACGAYEISSTFEEMIRPQYLLKDRISRQDLSGSSYGV